MTITDTPPPEAEPFPQPPQFATIFLTAVTSIVASLDFIRIFTDHERLEESGTAGDSRFDVEQNKSDLVLSGLRGFLRLGRCQCRPRHGIARLIRLDRSIPTRRGKRAHAVGRL